MVQFLSLIQVRKGMGILQEGGGARAQEKNFHITHADSKGPDEMVFLFFLPQNMSTLSLNCKMKL